MNQAQRELLGKFLNQKDDEDDDNLTPATYTSPRIGYESGQDLLMSSPNYLTGLDGSGPNTVGLANDSLYGGIPTSSMNSENEEENTKQNNVNEIQQKMLERMLSQKNSGLVSADAPTGFLGTAYNTSRRAISNLANIPNVSMAEDFATLAELKRKREAEDAELKAKGEERPWWYKILTWERDGKETAEELDALAADKAGDAYDRARWAQENFPMSEAGENQLREIVETDTWFGQDGAIMKALSSPLATSSAMLQVAGEQLPTLAAVMLTAKKNPKLAMGIMGGSSYLQERYGQLLEEAQKAGYDLSRPQDALKAVKDTEFMKEQADKGFTRGAIIASVDLAFLGLASKAKFNLSGIGTQTVVQGVGGGTGEALAQVATGEELQPGEILVEGLAEGVTGPIDVFAFGLRKANNLYTDDSGPSNSETALDAGIDAITAQELADETARLDANAKAEDEKAKDLNEKQDIEVGKKRLLAAKTFTPRD